MSSTNPAAVKLLNSSGRQLELRCDLRAPFCMWLAAQASMAASKSSFNGPGLECMRRYEVAQVYPHEDTPQWHAAIDLVQAGSVHEAGDTAPMLAEAELIRMVGDICGSVDELKGSSVDIQLSHASLLVAVLDHVGVAPAHQHAFMHAVMALVATRGLGERSHKGGQSQRAWAAFCKQLQHLNVPVGRAKPLLQQLPADAQDAVRWLQSVLPQASEEHSPAAQALQELELLADMLSYWGPGSSVKASTAVNPFMLIPAQYYRGAMFEVHVRLPPVAIERGSEADALSECICTGGTYDDFLQVLRPGSIASVAARERRMRRVALNPSFLPAGAVAVAAPQ